MKLFWRNHLGGDDVGTPKRVWREDWAGDQFEVMDYKSFQAVSAAVNSLNQVMRSTIVELEHASDD